ncbi:MAG TPA: MFS transporter, partial [Gemmatimonadales bacterium]|nr:MFS transporter [Gemmatimonadales bacterium]
MSDPPAAQLPRQVKLFGAVSLLNDFASEMVYPLLPAFITGVLGGGALALGALDGAADAAAALVKLIAGGLADRAERRGPLIVGGYFVAAAVRPIIAITAAAWQVIGLRVVDRLGKGLRTPPRDALIADVTPAPLVGRAFGLQRGLDHAGAIIGPLVALWFLQHGADVRRVILASFVPGMIVVFLAMWAVGDKRREPAGRSAVSAVPPVPAVPRLRPPFVIIAISFFYLLRMPETLMILRAQQLGIAVALIPLLWAALHVVRSSTSFLGGGLSDRIGPARTMWIGWLTYVALAAGMAFAATPLTAWIVFLSFGFVAGFTESPERALVSAATGGHRGSGFGVYHALTGVAALVGGVALGAIFGGANGATAFFVSAGGTLGLVLLWPFWTHAHR